jgi:hypothetical protein
LAEGSFQCDLSAAREDPLSTPLFDQLGVLCVPHVGTYGEDYSPLTPLALLRLPPEALDRAVLPLVGAEAAALDEVVAARTVSELWVALLPCAVLSECQHFLCQATNEVNLMLHTWLFRGALFTPEFRRSEAVRCGAFGTRGIRSAHTNLQKRFAGLPFGALEEREIGAHALAFSPCNNQFALEEGASLHSFCSIAQTAGGKEGGEGPRRVVTLHALAGTALVEDLLRQVCSSAKTVGELLDGVARIDATWREHAALLRRVMAAAASAPRK